MDERLSTLLLVMFILTARIKLASTSRHIRQAQPLPGHLDAYVKQLANNHQTGYQPPLLPFKPTPQQTQQSQSKPQYQPPFLSPSQQQQHQQQPNHHRSNVHQNHYSPPLSPVSNSHQYKPQPQHHYSPHNLAPYQANNPPPNYSPPHSNPRHQPPNFSHQASGYQQQPTGLLQKPQFPSQSNHALYIGGGKTTQVSPPTGSDSHGVSISTSYTADVIKQGKVVGSVQPSVQAIEKAPASEIQFDKGKNVAKDKAAKTGQPDDEYVIYYYYYYDEDKKSGKNLSLNFDDIPNLESYDQPAKPSSSRSAKQLVDKGHGPRPEAVPSNKINSGAPLPRRIPISPVTSTTSAPQTTTSITTTEPPVIVPNVFRYGSADIPRFPVTPNHLQPIRLDPVVTISQAFSPIQVRTTTATPTTTTTSTTTEDIVTEVTDETEHLEITTTVTEAPTTTTEPTTTTTEATITTTTEPTTTTTERSRRTGFQTGRFHAGHRQRLPNIGGKRSSIPRSSTTTTTTTTTTAAPVATTAPASSTRSSRRGITPRFNSNRFRRPSFGNNKIGGARSSSSKSNDDTTAQSSSSTTTTTTTTTQSSRQFGSNRRFSNSRNSVGNSRGASSISARTTASTSAPSSTRIRAKPNGISRSPLFGGNRGRGRPSFFRTQKTPEPEVEEEETKEEETTVKSPASSSTTTARPTEEDEDYPVENEEPEATEASTTTTTAKSRLSIFRSRTRPPLFRGRKPTNTR